MANFALLKPVIMTPLLTVLLLGTTNFVQAQANGVNICRGLDNDIARLACYDDLFAPLTTMDSSASLPSVATADSTFSDSASNIAISEATAVTTASTSAASMPLIPKIEDTPAIPNAVGKVMVQATPEIPEPPVQAAEQVLPKVIQSAEASFGAEQLVSSAQKDVATAIQSTVLEIATNVRGLRTFTLDNGQHWSESERSRLRIKEGQLMTIKKGALSAYYMSSESSNRSARVKRIK